MVDDRHEETQRFSGPCPGRDHKTPCRLGFRQRLRLMAVQGDGFASDPEYLARFRTNGATGHKLLDAVAHFKVGVDADQGLRPELTAGVDVIDLLPDIGGPDLRERTRKTLVIGYKCLIEVEYVH